MRKVKFVMDAYQLPIETIIARLGYQKSDMFFLAKNFSNSPFSPHYKRILQNLNPYAAYAVNNIPFILFFDKLFDNNSSFKDISKKIWNAQIPIAIFCDENTVKIFNGFSLNIASENLILIDSYAINNCNENSNFSYWQISNPTFWNVYTQNFSKSNLNKDLLNNIAYITKKLKDEYKISFAVKLVLRLIFIRYLIDRGVDLGYENFSSNIERSQQEFLNTLESKDETYSLFAYLKKRFNGNLFELDDEDKASELTEQVFSLLVKFFSGDIILSNGQRSLFNLYDFNIIPVELISNIYEILLGKEKQEKDNAFFTPAFLVDFILDKTIIGSLKKNLKCKILDPACGSGIFLVKIYQRIIQENLQGKLYCDNDEFLKRLLTDNIYGIDINEESIDITIFSLYLTILDYKNPKTLSGFILPNLKGKNLFVSDFFDINNLKALTDKNIVFDYIIGNPPWGNVKTNFHLSYLKEKKYNKMQQNNEIARSFVFRAKDFCTTSTICCFILPSKILYNQKNPAVRFRQFLLKETEICDIVELSAVRKLIFKEATAPATIISFKYNGQDNLNNNFVYTSIKPNIFFKLFHILYIEKNDIKYITQSLLFNNDWGWKTIIYGFSHDFENIINLKKKYPTLHDILNEQTPKILTGVGVEYQDGDRQDASHLQNRKLLDSKRGVEHFFINSSYFKYFEKKFIHRVRDKKLFSPPYVLIPTGIDCDNYKLKAVYTEESFVFHKTMCIIKGNESQKNLLLNLTGLLNSSFYAYLNLMLGSSIGVEREQRLMDEILSYPYVFSDEIAKKVEKIQDKLIHEKNEPLTNYEPEKDIKQLDDIIFKEFGLEKNNFINYSINVLIPELTNSNYGKAYNKVSLDELKIYARYFINHFAPIYAKINKYISVSLYPNIASHYTAFELCITDSIPNSEIEVNKENDDNFKNFLSTLSLYEYNDRFYQQRDVIHFSENSFFIIKPHFYKNWHPAIAEIDLAEVINQIMNSTGENE